MGEGNNNSRSGTQLALDAARAIKAAVRIVRAAIAAGLHGAAVAAAKEALPFLVKLAIGILIVVIVIPMVIFTALPNIFFGYDNAASQPVMDMTTKALEVGGAYMSVEDFERTQMDSIVTSLAAQYEKDGVHVDRIEVTSDFDEDDLLWLIAINSVAHEQNLDTMNAEDIRNLNISSLTYTPSLLSFITGEGETAVTTTTLKVDFSKLDPDEVMDKLGFDEDAKTWTGALFEVLFESDALEKYADQFEAYRPNYSGDSSYDGSYDRSDSYDNKIDISGFVSPHTKNNLDLVAYAKQAYENGWGYVWGTYGNVLTESLFAYKLEQYPDGVGNYEDFIRDNWLGRRTTDCCGLIKGYSWLNPDTLAIEYATNGMPDYGANQLYASAEEYGTDYGSMDSMPDIPGIALWKSGHIGVYVGGGMAVEAMGTKYGVVMTKVDGRGWQGWCKIPFITYMEESE